MSNDGGIDTEVGDTGVGLRSDLRGSARRIATTPELLVVTLALVGIATTLDVGAYQSRGSGRAAFNVAWAIWELVLLGFCGTQRVWFQHYLRLTDVVALTGRYLWRFVLLGLVLLVSGFFAVAAVDAIWVILGQQAPRHWSHPVDIGAFLILDMLLTFVVPPLVVTTGNPLKALWIGHRLIKDTWPACIWYLLLPGLTLALLARVLPATSSIPTIAVISSIGPMLALWFRGAILAFYLRHAPPATGEAATP